MQKAKRKPGRQPSNLYVRCSAIEPDQFLDLVDGRDTPRFQAQFACWLVGVALHHSRCTVDLVQRCFDAEPRKYRERLRAKLPKNLQLLPKARRERLQAEFARAVRVNGRRHRAALVRKLARLPCAAQVAELNRHLEQLCRRGLLQRPPRLSPSAERRALAGVPEDLRLGLTAQPPRKITLDEVQTDFYDQHPEFQRHRKIQHDLVFGRQLGGEAAAYFSRPGVSFDAHYLRQLAQDLAALPKPGRELNPGSKPQTVWEALCHTWKEVDDHRELLLGKVRKRMVRANRLRDLLKQEFHRDPAALRRFVGMLLNEHLRHLHRPHTPALLHLPEARERVPARLRLSRESNQDFRKRLVWKETHAWKNTELLAKAIGGCIKRLAGDDLARAQAYRLIHRAARYNRDVVVALRDFVFHGLPEDQIRTRPGLVAKLVSWSETNDVPLLLRFLFQATANKPLGLIPQWIRDDQPGSLFRTELAQSHTWPWQVAQKHAGKSEKDFFEDVEALAGHPKTAQAVPKTPGTLDVSHQSLIEEKREKRLEAYAKRRKRSLGSYPK